MNDRVYKELDLWEIFDGETIEDAIKKLQRLEKKYGSDYNLRFDVEFAGYREDGKTIYLIGEKK